MPARPPFSAACLLLFGVLLALLSLPRAASGAVSGPSWVRVHNWWVPALMRYQSAPVALAVDECGNSYGAGLVGEAPVTDALLTARSPTGIHLWDKTERGPGGWDLYRHVAARPGGGAIALGLYYPGGNPGLLVASYNAEGERQWLVRYPDAPRALDPTGIRVDSQGNAYVLAQSIAALNREIVLLKFSADGELLWSVRDRGPDGLSAIPVGLALDGDQGVYVAGNCRTTATGEDWVLLRYAPDGVQEWSTRYNGPWDSTDYPTSIAADPTGGLVVCGAVSGPPFRIVQRYTREGSLTWAVPQYWADAKVMVDRTGLVTVVGTQAAEGMDHHGVLRLNAAGGELWRVSLPAPDFGNIVPPLVAALDPAGRVYLAHQAEGEGTGLDIRIVALDQQGGARWTEQVDSGLNSAEYPYGIFADGAGSVYVSGLRDSLPGSSGVMIKVDAVGLPPVIDLFDANPRYTGSVRLPLPSAEVIPADLGEEAWAEGARRVTGVAADGVSLLLVRVPVPEGAEGEVHFRLATTSAGQSAGSLWSIGDPGLWDRTAQGNLRDRAEAGSTELHAPVVTLNGRKWGLALYRAPRDFYDVYVTERSVRLIACFPGRLGAGFDSQTELPIRLLRAPVMLVHGTFSDPYSAWLRSPFFGQSGNEMNGFQPLNLPFHVLLLEYSSVDGAAGPAGASARHLLPQFSRKLRLWRERHQVAATQADVVTHSYGGVVTRVAAQLHTQPDFSGDEETNFRAAHNWGHGPIHRLITIAATHRGSVLPNHMAYLNRIQDGWPASISRPFQVNFWGGAMADQFVARGAARLLTRATPFGGHAVVGSSTLQELFSKEASPFLLMRAFDFPDGPYMAAGNLLNLSDRRRLTNYVFNMSYTVGSGEGTDPNYDLTVSSRSAIGGLPRSACSLPSDYHFSGISHLQETEHPAINNRIVYLLTRPTVSSFFTPFPPFDPNLSEAERKLQELADPADLYLTPVGTTARGTGAAPQISVSPTGPVAPGQTLTVSVTWPQHVTQSTLLLTSSDGGPEAQELAGPAPQAVVTVPDTAATPFRLQALVRDTAGVRGEANLELPVTDPRAYEELTAVPEAVTLDGSGAPTVAILGRTSEGDWMDLTRSVRTTFQTSPPGVVEVLPNGSLRGLAAGGAILTATVSGSGSVDVPITVTRPTPLPPAAPASLVASAAVEPTRVALSWSFAGGGADGFEIERRQGDGSFGFIAVVGADARAYEDVDVEEKTAYGYRVRAFNGGGVSAYSAEAQALTVFQEGGKLQAPRSVNFGKVRVGETRERVLKVKNGDRRRSLSLVVEPAAGNGFTTTGAGVHLLAPGQRASFTLRFTPSGAGRQQGALTLRSGDPRRRVVVVKLIGQGK